MASWDMISFQKFLRSLYFRFFNISAKTKEVLVPNQVEANQRPKRVRRISLGCENFTLFTILRRRDISKTCFYNTLNLRRVDTTKLMKKEVIARGLGINNNKGLDAAANHVKNTKVLPLGDDALSSRHQRGNEVKGDQKAKSEKTKTLSKMKELVRWAAASKSKKEEKYINRKVNTKISLVLILRSSKNYWII